jgi:acetyltransferase-like isoleucine patch superfamily enzyme
MTRQVPDGLHIVENCTVGDGTTVAEFSVLQDCTIGDDCDIWRFVNLYGCTIGDECMVGSLVEIQDDVTIGDNCRIQSHAFVSSLAGIGDDVFVSHGVKFINDRYAPVGDSEQWEETVVHDGATIGTNATLLPVEIGANAMVGAGAVVTEDVPPGAVVVGNPGEVVRYRDD